MRPRDNILARFFAESIFHRFSLEPRPSFRPPQASREKTESICSPPPALLKIRPQITRFTDELRLKWPMNHPWPEGHFRDHPSFVCGTLWYHCYCHKLFFAGFATEDYPPATLPNEGFWFVVQGTWSLSRNFFTFLGCIYLLKYWVHWRIL